MKREIGSATQGRSEERTRSTLCVHSFVRSFVRSFIRSFFQLFVTVCCHVKTLREVIRGRGSSWWLQNKPAAAAAMVVVMVMLVVVGWWALAGAIRSRGLVYLDAPPLFGPPPLHHGGTDTGENT